MDGRAQDIAAGGPEPEEPAAALDHVLATAAGGGPAALGLEPGRESVAWGVGCRLFVDRGARAEGTVCRHCGVLAASAPACCPLCGRPVEPVDLIAVNSEDVRAMGGRVEIMEGHEPLTAGGGVAACLRHAVPRARPS